MSSSAKKRKLNDGRSSSTVPARGLEYFFSRQRQNGTPETVTRDSTPRSAADDRPAHELTDEELARKLQAEWDQEVRNERPVETGAVELSSGRQSHSASSPEKDPPESKPEASHPQMKTLSLSSVANAEDTVSFSIPFDQSPLTFDPADYAAKLEEHWAAEDGNASYALLTRCFVLVNGTQSRIKIVDTLVNFVRVMIEADPSSLLPAVWLATNAISPPYISLELGLGGSAISKALKKVCGLDSQSLKRIYDKHGDAGDVAFEAKKKQSFTLRKPKPLTIKSVYQSLVKIANSQGQGSGEAKQRLVDRLLQDARGGEESRYIVRTLCQHVR